MNRLWQIMPSMAFKLGLYQAAITVAQARMHGNFGVGQFAALDGELTVVNGEFFHAKDDGSVHLADDAAELCFAQLCHFAPTESWTIEAPQDIPAFEASLHARLPSPNDFLAFQLSGYFSSIVPTAPPAMSQPYPPFSEVGNYRRSFPIEGIEATVVGYYSPAFTGDIGIPGFHFHMVSADRNYSGHVTSFEVASGTVHAARLREMTLQLPATVEYEAAILTPAH